ncbi:alpha/beta hydrolase [Alteromonas sp. KUL49]|uniref:alpha/beta fold hydrolase n=1 Tax=Alteromonas sp. KUL49 TaxID=2480798 RepID=UPI00102EE2C5|nr:alpha/beta hydrolase [Alteromonas sp. KUL49]TAP40188.1 alpha/beta hydrolase [Alteromonas sp. KUL49]GEA11314.1 alpha/beta hydrolase [Alteromonas sp. KUL49]
MSKVTFHFAHANGFPAPSYNVLFSALPNAYERIHVDKFGHDPLLPVNKNWRNQVTELINHIASYNNADGIYAIGHSFGAVISYMAACEAPHLFKGLIMLDPPLVVGPMSTFLRLVKKTPLIDKVTPANLAKTRNTQWDKQTDMVSYFQSKALFKYMDERCVRDYVNAVTEHKDDKINLTFSADVEANLFRNVPHNLNRYQGKLACPALLVTAKNSKVCHPMMIKALRKQNNVDHMVAPGGHMFPLEQPEKVAEIITATLERWES